MDGVKKIAPWVIGILVMAILGVMIAVTTFSVTKRAKDSSINTMENAISSAIGANIDLDGSGGVGDLDTPVGANMDQWENIDQSGLTNVKDIFSLY